MAQIFTQNGRVIIRIPQVKVYTISGIRQYSVIYSVIYKAHVNQLSCSFLINASVVVFLFCAQIIEYLYVVKSSLILIFLSILFYVIQSRSDKVTVLSVRMANINCSNNMQQGSSEPQ